jgi:hypothetical protein
MLEASANGQSFNVTVPAGKAIVCPFRAILCPKIISFFYQDRLGTHTHRKSRGKRCVRALVCRRCRGADVPSRGASPPRAASPCDSSESQRGKLSLTVVLRCHSFIYVYACIETIVLPRQARDKHRDSTQKRAPCFFLQGPQAAGFGGNPTASLVPQGGSVAIGEDTLLTQMAGKHTNSAFGSTTFAS